MHRVQLETYKTLQARRHAIGSATQRRSFIVVACSNRSRKRTLTSISKDDHRILVVNLKRNRICSTGQRELIIKKATG
jgi:hypothetical protein